MAAEKIDVENINVPGHTSRVDASKYNEMKSAYLAALPNTKPGMTAAEAKAALLPHLDQHLFPSGNTAGWWLKTVQLDLEAKGIVKRTQTKPLRFYKV